MAIEKTISLRALDRWTLSFALDLEEGAAPTTARTRITQPRGYSQTLQAPVELRQGCAHWQLTYPLCDEGAYQPVNRRCDWGMGEYRFAVELLRREQVVHRAMHTLSPLDFVPHTFRGTGPLIGFYSQYLVECAPDRPVYIDTDEMSVSFRTIPARAKRCTATMDVVEAGGKNALAGPWELQLDEARKQQKFSSAGWRRGEYWVRLQLHWEGRPVGAYMVRSVWKEILPPEREPGPRPVEGFQPAVGAWSYGRLHNTRFDADPMQPRPDNWLVSQQKPWESEFLSVASEAVHYDPQEGHYSLDLAVGGSNVHRPVEAVICRIVSDDGIHWRRPHIGRIAHQGSTANNIIGYPNVDATGKPTWPLRPLHQARVAEDPALLPDLEQLSIRFYDPERDGPVDPAHCFVKSTGWDLLQLCTFIDPAVRAQFSTSERSPEHIRFQAYAVERRANELLLLSREPLLRSGSGMDLHHTTESFRYTLEDRATGTYYYYFRPGAHSYPPHYSPLDNIHMVRRVLAVMWTRDYLHWERRFVLSPDEEDLDGTQFYHMYLHNQPAEAAQSSPGALLGGLPAVDGKRVYFGALTYYDAHRSQMWPELLWTADFLHWHRLEKRRKMIPNSAPGRYSFGAVRHSGIFTEIDATWWMAFNAYRLPYKYPNPNRHHWEEGEFARKNAQYAHAPDFENWEQFYEFCRRGYSINPALAVAPAGRLAHAEAIAAAQPAELVTTPVLLAGKALFVNAATAAGGSVRVELQDAEGTPLAGFELEVCQPLQGNELHHRVQWREREIAVLETQPVQIRFVLDQARFYGYSAQ